MLLPISYEPTWMRMLAHFNPLYYLVEDSCLPATRTLTGTAVCQGAAVLAPLCAVLLASVTSVVRKVVS